MADSTQKTLRKARMWNNSLACNGGCLLALLSLPYVEEAHRLDGTGKRRFNHMPDLWARLQHGLDGGDARRFVGERQWWGSTVLGDSFLG